MTTAYFTRSNILLLLSDRGQPARMSAKHETLISPQRAAMQASCLRSQWWNNRTRPASN